MTSRVPSPYAMIIAALPRHGPLLHARRPPLSRIALERRLKLLSDEDRREIENIEGALSWSHVQHLKEDDAGAVRHIKAAADELRSTALRLLVLDRLNLRALVAALRRRMAGEATPMRKEDIPGTPYAARIRRSWSAQGFRLGPSESWLRRVDQALSARDPLAAEREILVEVWKRLARARARHPGGLEAVAIYVMQWSLIDRWTRQDALQASHRFAAWVRTSANQALAEEGAP